MGFISLELLSVTNKHERSTSPSLQHLYRIDLQKNIYIYIYMCVLNMFWFLLIYKPPS